MAELDGMSRQMADFIEEWIKKRSIRRNDPCPCGSGKKYKKCCLGKSHKEILKKRDRRNFLIKKIEKLPDYAYIVPKPSDEIQAFSTTYGPYKFRSYNLYFSRQNIKMSDKSFSSLFSEIDGELATTDLFRFRTNILVDIKTGKIDEMEIIMMGFKKEFVLQALKDIDYPIYNDAQFQMVLNIYLSRMINDLLNARGYTSFYSRIGTISKKTDFDELKKEHEQDQKKQFVIDIRPAQKMLYMTSILSDIEKNCDSPIEVPLCKKLVEESIPFVQHYPVTPSFPETKSNDRIITKPDMLIGNDTKAIAIYCDGHMYHQTTKEQAFRDKNIDRELQKMGFVVLRFTGSEIFNNIERCVEEIKTHYVGEGLSKTPQEVLLTQLYRIDYNLLTEWEKRFYQTMFDYIENDRRLSLKQERIIKRLVDKTSRYYRI